MTTTSLPAVDVSPRTAERPMAFTWSEFLGGSWAAFLVYQPMGAVTFTLLWFFTSLFRFGYASDVGSAVGSFFFMFFMGGIFGVVISLCAWIAGSPLAYVLGRCLQRVRDERIHLAAFSVLGLGIGLATVVAWLSLQGDEPLSVLSPFFWFALPAAVAVPYGQHRAATRALRADAAAAAEAGKTGDE